MKNVLTPARGAIAAALILGAASPAYGQLRSALNVGEEATRQAEQVQERINQLDDQRSDLVREFRTLIQRKDAAELYARQQQQVVASQEREIESLQEQLTRVDEITAEMIPMMLQMIDDLEDFVRWDLPFKREERLERVADLREVMNRADVVPAEQYRLIIQAYQSELEYGNTIDTWSATVDVDGQPTTVNMFQYGRVALTYLTPDGRRAARWDRDAGAWVELPGQFRSDIDLAIRVASETAQQEVLFGPAAKFSTGMRPLVRMDDEMDLPPLEAEYRSILARVSASDVFQAQQERLIANQEAEIADLQAQLEQVATLPGDAIGAMEQMIADLETFVAADLPFLRDERRDRIQTLKDAMVREDLFPGQKYQLILDAYFAELDYGNSTAAWVETVEIGGEELTVDMYRYGRASLVYVTPDRRRAGWYNTAAGAWEELPGRFTDEIDLAIRIANGTAQEQILFAPVARYTAPGLAQ